MEHDKFIKFQSRVGNAFVAPSQWTAQDKGSVFSLRSPDGHAIIHALTYAAEGSGSMETFGQTILASLLPQGKSGWAPSDWSTIQIAKDQALRRDLVPLPTTDDRRWRVYLLHTDTLYHAIVLNASDIAMRSNGGFYEDIVRTFQGIRRLPT